MKSISDFSRNLVVFRILIGMNVVIAIDSFKGSLTSVEAGNAAAAGILRVFPDAEIHVRPVADGGEGTVDALCSGMNGTLAETPVTGPLGDRINARYAILPDKITAVMEMSAAAGLTLVPAEKRNPLLTTTYGVGELIADAIRRGCRNFVIGIGGSATNDGGAGMLQALGFSFRDKNKCEIPRGAAGLAQLASLSCENVLPELKDCRFRVACDVTNPLCGENGCSAVYGPQKGADPDMIREMDTYLAHYAAIVHKSFPDKSADTPGAGAAGGLGFAFSAFLGGTLERGVDLILDETSLESYICNADVVITGEGRLDAQTAMGKAPAGVSAVAKKYGKTVIAFSGCVNRDASVCHSCGIDAYFPILRSVVSLDEALERDNAYANLSDTAEQLFRVVKVIAEKDK